MEGDLNFHFVAKYQYPIHLDRQEDGGKKEVNEEMLISNTTGLAGGWREERSE